MKHECNGFKPDLYFYCLTIPIQMKKIIWLMMISNIYFTSVTAQNNLLKLEDIWGSRMLASMGLGEVRSMKDGKHFTELTMAGSIQCIVKNEYSSGKTVDTLYKSSAISSGEKTIMATDYQFNADESKILLSTETESIYRHSTKSNHLVYDIGSKKATPLSAQGKQMYAQFSPAGNRIAFVRDNNLFLVDLKDFSESQITTDGKKNEIINGATDWVYEEEFSFDQAYQWSPSGNHIAFYRFDETHVKEFTLTYYGDLYPKEDRYKYPKAGEDNSKVEIYIFNISKGTVVKTDVNKEADQYIPRIKWTSDASRLCVMRMNRLQNLLELYSCDANTGKAELFFTETNPAYIEVTDDLTFLKDNKGFVWSSTKDGYNHIYLYDMKGKLRRQITSGKWDVTAFYGYDEVNRKFYYQAAVKSPMEKGVFVGTMDGKRAELNAQDGTNSATFSASYDYYFITNSAINRPHTVNLYTHNGKLVRNIRDNKEVASKLKEYNMGTTEFFKFTTSENVELNGWMIKPPGFMPENKYPVIQYMYGGPGSQTVKNEWLGPNYLWFQLLAQKGYVIVSVDNRGTGARGEAFNKCIYKQLGHLETIDQIEVAKWLKSQTYIDGSRIGAWGWSYGGYMTSLLITKGADHFKAAVAVAPVTTWRYYDTIYTERYLQTPQMNAKGYDDNSPINFTNLMKGNYLLVHGSTDDNVHMQNTMDLVTALVKDKKQFESFIYPNKAHGIGGVRLHLYEMMTRFFTEKL
jgi:dipeptidyl-peptidase 4